MANSIHEFCEKRNIPIKIESAFRAYCKTDYALKFELREGDTVAKLVSNLTNEQILDAWNCFVVEFRRILPETNLP